MECNAKNCLAINHRKSVLLTEEGQYVLFQNFKRLGKAPFIIYGDYEYVLIAVTDNIDFCPNTKKNQDHIFCTYGYKLICVDDLYSTAYKAWFGEYAIDKYLHDMMK